MLSIAALTAIIVLTTVYFFLITEKIDKVIVTVIGATFLILIQEFKTADHTSQENALQFVSHNLDTLGFVIGMMIFISILRQSGVFEALAIWLVKTLKGRPTYLLTGIGYLTFFMTMFISNIPTVLILSPVLIVLIRQLKLPFFPFFFIMITMANLGGAMTPISDPTTYYEAKTVGLGFMEVVMNSGVVVLCLSVVSTIFCQLVFRRQLLAVKVSPKDVAKFKPSAAIKDRRILAIGLPMLAIAILVMALKEQIALQTGVAFDNATIILATAFASMLIFNVSPTKALHEYVGWEIVFFFLGLFVVVGALDFTGVIDILGTQIVALTGGSLPKLLAVITLGSGVLSTFIDNVPYNITMVGAIQSMAESGIAVYPLWWALNVGTSIGGAGSMIGAACNVIALGIAEKEGFHTSFLNYLKYGFALVLINGVVAYGILALKFL